MNFITTASKEDMKIALQNARKYTDFCPDEALKTIQDELLFLAGKKERDASNQIRRLQVRWYDSLERGVPDYGVYSDPYYFCDIWVCWAAYSFKGVKVLADKKSFQPDGVAASLGEVRKVLDLGCGLGYTTSALSLIFPKAKVYGTNLQESWQFAFAKDVVGTRAEIVPSVKEVGPVDVVFASEYFEHFEKAVEHTHEIITAARPMHVIVANAFSGTAIGHFKQYKYLGKGYSGKETSALFSSMMKHFGYKKVPTKIWNNRPALWSRDWKRLEAVSACNHLQNH
jgi:hypothetical protein